MLFDFGIFFFLSVLPGLMAGILAVHRGNPESCYYRGYDKPRTARGLLEIGRIRVRDAVGYLADK